jgi:phage gpG-like protein
VQLIITSHGIKTAHYNMEEIGRRTRDMRSTAAKIIGILAQGTEKQFDSQGRRGGGSWGKLDKKWAARKRAAGLDPRILHAKLKLRQSVTQVGNPNMSVKVSDRGYKISFGSRLPYAARQQATRPYLVFVDSDLKKIEKVILGDLLAGWRVK